MKNICLVVISIAVLFSCKKMPKLTPLSPLDTIDVITDIEFRWTSNHCNDNQRFLLYQEPLSIPYASTEPTLILDTLVDGETFLYDKQLLPDHDYHWVLACGDVEQSASFKTADVLQPYTGDYAMQVRRACEHFSTCADSFFLDTVCVYASGKDLQVCGNDYRLAQSFMIFNPSPNKDFLYFGEYPTPPRPQGLVSIDMRYDSIHIELVDYPNSPYSYYFSGQKL